jgi:hypothetical protein
MLRPMFVGHFAVAFAARRVESRLSLPLLVTAAAFLDILWPMFVLLGIEHSRIAPGITLVSPLDLHDVPYSHSLVTSILWSALFSLPLVVNRRIREAAVLDICVFSHFVLDWITHRPDLPLAPGSSVKFGLGLWNHLAASILIEATLFALGVWLYVSGTRATNRMGTLGLWSFVGILTVAWLSGPFGPPPPSIESVVVSALVVVPLIILWSWRIDRGRIRKLTAV